MKTRGKYFRKETWYSFCSMHQQYNENCSACNAGSWSNDILRKIGSVIYKTLPKLWIWGVNRKYKKYKK